MLLLLCLMITTLHLLPSYGFCRRLFNFSLSLVCEFNIRYCNYDFVNRFQYVRSTTPVQLAKDDFFLYFTRKSCNPFFKSQNPVLRLIRELMVTPLTNFTGLSLYFQLYLVEIFHVKFFTKFGHYLCMVRMWFFIVCMVLPLPLFYILF